MIGPKTAPAGFDSALEKNSEPSCLTTSRPMAPMTAPCMAGFMGTLPRGSDASIQKNRIQFATRPRAMATTVVRMPMPGTPSRPTFSTSDDVRPEEPMAVTAKVRAIISIMPSRRMKSRSLPSTKFSAMIGRFHRAVTPMRRLPIQLRPDHRAVMKPMVNTPPAWLTALSMIDVTVSPISPLRFWVMPSSMVCIISSLPRSTKPRMANANIKSGKTDSTEKYVTPAAKWLPPSCEYRSCMRMTWSSHPYFMRILSTKPGSSSVTRSMP